MSGFKEHHPKKDFIALAEAAKIAGYTPEYLNLLSRKGILKAKKIGRNWFTTQAWLDEFVDPGLVNIEREVEIKIDPEKDVAQKNDAAPEKMSFIRGEDSPDDNYGLDYLDELDKYAGKPGKGFFKFFKNKKRISKRRWNSPGLFSLAVVVILIFLGVSQAVRVKKDFDNNKLSNLIPLPAEEGKIQTLDSPEPGGVVLGTQTENNNGIILASENYAIKEIKFGGDVSLLASGDNNLPLQVTDIRSEIITTKNDGEAQLLVYWKTNKLAQSNIEYLKMGSDASRKISEDSFGFIHSVVIPALDPATAYTYVISAKDKWGNVVTSDKYSTYTGSKAVSVFDLIVKAAEDTFGWAMHK